MPNETSSTKRAKAEVAELRIKLDEHIKLDRERRKEIRALRKELSVVNQGLKNALKSRDQAQSAQETLYGENCKLQQELESAIDDKEKLCSLLIAERDEIARLERKFNDTASELVHNNGILEEVEDAFVELIRQNQVLEDKCGELSDRVDSFVIVVTELTKRLS